MDDTLIRVFPRRTSMTPDDPLAFVGDPPLMPWRPEAAEVHVSCTFTWDLPEARRLVESWQRYYAVVRLGGPALGDSPLGFVSGRYIRRGVTFTTRGCNRSCCWCLVPKHEGKFRTVDNFASGNVIQDNNLLQSPPDHLDRVFSMLKQEPRAAVFSGGLDWRLIDDGVIRRLQGCRLQTLFLSADTHAVVDDVCQVVAQLRRELGVSRQKIRVYLLAGFGNDAPNDAHERCLRIWRAGGMPFLQLYQPAHEYIEYGPTWRELRRTWTRPAAMIAETRGDAISTRMLPR